MLKYLESSYVFNKMMDSVNSSNNVRYQSSIQSFLRLFVNPSVHQGPVVRSIVSLTSSLRVMSLTVLADLIHNILIFFAEKM